MHCAKWQGNTVGDKTDPVPALTDLTVYRGKKVASCPYCFTGNIQAFRESSTLSSSLSLCHLSLSLTQVFLIFPPVSEDEPILHPFP